MASRAGSRTPSRTTTTASGTTPAAKAATGRPAGWGRPPCGRNHDHPPVQGLAAFGARSVRVALPFAAYQVVARHPQAGLFSPGGSLLVLIAWPVATLVTAGVLLARRDL